MYNFHPAILAVNRQINLEASQTLRQNQFVKLTTNALAYEIDFKTDGLPVVAEDASASCIIYSAIELTLTLSAGTYESYPCVLMFAGDDMITFCRILLRSPQLGGYYKSSLTINVSSIASTPKDTSKLLEPLCRLRGMALVNITGQIETEHKKHLIERMVERLPEINAIVQEVQDTIAQGDQAASDKDYCTALGKYKRALDDNDDFSCQYGAPDIVLKAGRFKGQTLDIVFFQTSFALRSKLAIVYLKLKNYSRAHDWTIPNLVQIHGYRQRGAACASIYSIAAQASEGLGLIERAVGEMNEAVWHDPRDSKLATELVRLKRKTQSGGGWLEVL